MLDPILAKIFGTRNEREVKRLRPIVAAINDQEPQLQQLSDADLAAKTVEFKQRIANGEPLDDLLIESFAVCREAGFSPTIVQETNDTQTIVSLVSAGFGVALVPTSIATFPRPHVAYRPLSGRNAQLELALAARRNDSSPLVDRFREVAERVASTPAPSGHLRVTSSSRR